MRHTFFISYVKLGLEQSDGNIGVESHVEKVNISRGGEKSCECSNNRICENASKLNMRRGGEMGLNHDNRFEIGTASAAILLLYSPHCKTVILNSDSVQVWNC